MSQVSIDMSSFQGLISSVIFITLAQVFAVMSFLSVLQGISYFMAILIAVDTLTGNPIKSWATKLIKKFKHAHNKSKSTGPKSN